MEKRVNFLSRPTDEQLRREVLNISESYSNPWDVMAELLQNAVDAVKAHRIKFGEGKKHQIHVEISQATRSILVRDTGVGFQPGRLAELLAPHGTDKDPEDARMIGQKGVGLTYAVFAANRFRIKSRSVDGYIEARIDRARDWKRGFEKSLPELVIETETEEQGTYQDTFTEITLEDLEERFGDDDLLSQPKEVIVYLLRSRTAIGCTRDLMGRPENPIEIYFSLERKDHSKVTEPIPFKFFAPEEVLAKGECIDVKAFRDLAAQLDDRQRAKRLRGKYISEVGSEFRGGRDIRYYVLMAHSRSCWKSISRAISPSSQVEEDSPLCRGGIFIATRGMPTGVEITPPATGSAAYWPLFYMLIEDDTLVFDLGRKSIPNRTVGLFRDIARERFVRLSGYVKYTSDDVPTTPIVPGLEQHDKQRGFERLHNLPPLGAPSIPYLKHPDLQEAGVSAIFHELVGAGVLKGYRPLKTGHRMQYDLWAVYRATTDNVGKNLHSRLKGDVYETDIIIEFKYNAEDIISDVSDDTKYFPDIDLLVCWDLNPLPFSKERIEVQSVDADDAFYFGTNYTLRWPGSYNLGTAGNKPVISLRRFIEDRAGK